MEVPFSTIVPEVGFWEITWPTETSFECFVCTSPTFSPVSEIVFLASSVESETTFGTLTSVEDGSELDDEALDDEADEELEDEALEADMGTSEADIVESWEFDVPDVAGAHEIIARATRANAEASMNASAFVKVDRLFIWSSFNEPLLHHVLRLIRS